MSYYKVFNEYEGESMNRILELERLIPEAESLLERTPHKFIEEHARLSSQIEQYRLEYRERTAQEYKPVNVADVCRQHGVGA